MNRLCVALLQMSACGSDQQRNLDTGLSRCRDAARLGADIALMPELWNIGYMGFGARDDVRKWQSQAVATDGDWVGQFRKLAREVGMAIAVTYLESWPGAPRNTVSLIDRHGEIALTYAKVHTCDFVDFEAATTPGDGWPVCELDTAQGSVSVGAMICYDREHPESARCLMLNGAELILTPNACILDDLKISQFQVRAMENAAAVAMANYPAPAANGRSVAFDAGGAPIVEADDQESVIIAEFDLGAIRDCRARTIWGDAFRRPHRYAPLSRIHDLPVFRRSNAFGERFDAGSR